MEVNWRTQEKGTVLLEQGDAGSDAPYRPRLSVHVPGGTSEKGCIDQIAVALKRILTAGVGLRLYLRTYRTYRYDLNIGHGAMVNVVRWLPPVSQDRSSRADFKIGHGGFTEADFYPPIVGKDRLFESRFETSRGTYLPPVIEGVYPDTVQTATTAHEGVRGAVYHTHLKPRRID